MPNLSGFSRAWRHLSKNSARYYRAELKKRRSRLNRREGKLHFEDATIHRLSERKVT